jgi:ureidoacrylate peracid hydrolase
MNQFNTLSAQANKIGLVIVDLQNDFMAPDGAYMRGNTFNPEALLLPERLSAVAKAVKHKNGLVVASLFTLWPDSEGEPMISEHLLERRPFLRKGDFAPGSWGQANIKTISPWIDIAVCKVAYSAFFNTQLDWILRRAGVDTVVVCGIVTNGGVASTVRDAQMRDYRTLVLSDGCVAFSEMIHKAAITDMTSVAEVMTCEQFLEIL